MNRAVEFLSPLRWPLALLLLAADLITQVPPDSRDAYQLVAVGASMLLALRIVFNDHEAREVRRAEAREARLDAQDEGVEAAKVTLQAEQARLAGVQEDLGGLVVARIRDLKEWQDQAETRLGAVERLFFPGS